MAKETSETTKHRAEAKAIELARKCAAAGPRVAAVLEGPAGVFTGVPGYLDHDMPDVKQVMLVTPDGRVWIPQD